MAIKGMKELQRKLSSLSKEGAKEFADITKINALEIQANAKRDAPIADGDLRQSIVAIEETEYNWSVGSNLGYAPFVEFGTGKKVQIPKGFESLASEARNNNKGSFNDGLKRIKEWCRKKGIPESASYHILVSLINNGQAPKPYLIPNFLRQKSQYRKDLSNAIKRLVK